MGLFVELSSGKIFKLTATVTGMGLKIIGSNGKRLMGNTWEKIGFIRSAK